MIADRLALKGRRTELKEKKAELAAKAGAIIDALNAKAAPLILQPLEEMDAGGIVALAKDLAGVVTEYKETMDDLRTVENALR